MGSTVDKIPDRHGSLFQGGVLRGESVGSLHGYTSEQAGECLKLRRCIHLARCCMIVVGNASECPAIAKNSGAKEVPSARGPCICPTLNCEVAKFVLSLEPSRLTGSSSSQYVHHYLRTLFRPHFSVIVNMTTITIPKLSADDPMAGMTHSEVHYFNRYAVHRI